MPIRGFLSSDRTNAAVVWALAAGIAAATAGQALAADWLWAMLGVTTVALALFPSAVHRTWTVTPPWWTVVLAAIPLAGLVLFPFATQSHALVTRVATYLSIASLSLLVAIYLNVYTDVEMSHRFAVVFVVVTTMALAGLWVLLVGLGDIYFGMNHIAGKADLNKEFVTSFVTGLFGGVLFERYFHHSEHGGLRGAVTEGR